MIDVGMIEACAPGVAVETIQAIVRVESAGDPLALNANRSGKPVRLKAEDLADAIRLARAEIAAGNTVDIGLMQINSANLPVLGRTVEQLFNPCTNLHAGATILTGAYAAAIKAHGEGQAALQAALSHYNTGNFQRGFANGYVARYYQQHATPKALPNQAKTAQIYGASPTVYMLDPTPQQQEKNVMSDQTSETNTMPVITTDQTELMRPGVQVEVTPDEAEQLGIVEETALDERDAWESNQDAHAFGQEQSDGL